LQANDGRDDNPVMPSDPWQASAKRAEALAVEVASAAEVLRFYARVAGFQGEVYQSLAAASITSADLSFTTPPWRGLAPEFRKILTIAAAHGPATVSETASMLEQVPDSSILETLSGYWIDENAAPSPGWAFLARSVLQPYAAYVRSRTSGKSLLHTPCVCPYCSRKPGAGVLRPLGDGGQRSLVCSLCVAEWEFRRIICPGCGEENHAKLPVYSAEEFPHVRVECCDACKQYIKTVDLTKNGLADPIADEIATIPLDLWAQDQGYAKLQINLMQY
jgi:FdhE protein